MNDIEICCPECGKVAEIATPFVKTITVKNWWCRCGVRGTLVWRRGGLRRDGTRESAVTEILGRAPAHPGEFDCQIRSSRKEALERSRKRRTGELPSPPSRPKRKYTKRKQGTVAPENSSSSPENS